MTRKDDQFALPPKQAAGSSRLESFDQRLRDLNEHVDLAIRGTNVSVFGQDLDLRYTWIRNPLVGFEREQMLGKSDAELFSPSVAAALTRVKRAAIDRNETQFAEVEMYHDGKHRWFELWADPVSSQTGTVEGLACAAVEITSRKQDEEQMRTLLLELNHRNRNLLSVIEGIARQTGRDSGDIKNFLRRFSGRLHSLSITQLLLTESNWKGAGMRALLKKQIKGVDNVDLSRFTFHGPDIVAGPNATQYLGLAIHELTNNALQHGALSAAEGTVTVTWKYSSGAPDSPERPGIEFHWKETGGPNVSPPTEKRYGRSILEAILPRSLSASSTLIFGGDGVSFSAFIPVRELHISAERIVELETEDTGPSRSSDAD